MDKEKIGIQDKSGDRKYYTQIPNMIVNHSTAYEQSLYLIMKRLAGEYGSCFASLNFLRVKMGVAKRTVSGTISKLLKRGWIKEIENKKVSGGVVRQFVIVDLWKLNIDNYEGGTQMTTLKKKGGTQKSRGGTQITRGGTQVHTKKIYNNKEEDKQNSSSKKLKPFFRGEQMRKSKGKWWVIPANGDQWLEFAGKEKEISWK
ncbi:MAG TPA: helix-turn-helix domain-containing protein [Candidatus Scalindua sp.]|nr:helix-turn-helix domain-containing protein [Candidatus Scalindua sp.]